MVSTQLAHDVGRWRAVGDPTLCPFWAGSFSFISAKIYDLVVKKNRLDERVLLSI